MSRRKGARKPHRSWPQRLLLLTNCALAVACLGVAGGLWKLRAEVNAIPRANLDGALAPQVAPGAPRNILIIGTDSAAGLDSSDPVAKGREEEQLADVIMIMRVDPAAGTARLLSIPRDSWVRVAPNWRFQKINGAMETTDGPASLVRTIRRNFGISIDNYVALDFAGFRKLVDVLGGVPIHFTVPMRDPATGLFIEKPGCYTLDSTQALAYARSRKLEFKNPMTGKWVDDPAGDLARIERQQDFIKRSLRRASDKGLRDPATAAGVVDAAASAVVLDDTLSVRSILDLLGRFRTFNPDDLASYQVPTEEGPSTTISYQKVLWDPAEPVLQLFRGGEGGTPQASDVIVDVQVPSGDGDGEGTMSTEDAITPDSTLVTDLEGAGFDTEAIKVRTPTTTATIYHGPEGRTAAEELARHLAGTFTLAIDPELTGYRLVLAPGTGGGVTVRPEPLAPGSSVVPPSEQPDSTDPEDGSTATTTAGRDGGDTTDGDRTDGDDTSTTTPASGASGSTGASGPDGAVAPPVTQEPQSAVPKDPVAAAACR